MSHLVKRARKQIVPSFQTRSRRLLGFAVDLAHQVLPPFERLREPIEGTDSVRLRIAPVSIDSDQVGAWITAWRTVIFDETTTLER
jgi:hypothetical protein